MNKQKKRKDRLKDFFENQINILWLKDIQNTIYSIV